MNGMKVDETTTDVHYEKNQQPQQQQNLENIEEDYPMYFPSPANSPPETPDESMEFLSRSWSISAADICKALEPYNPTTMNKFANQRKLEKQTKDEDFPIEPTPFVFSSLVTSQLVMSRILSPVCLQEYKKQNGKSGPLSNGTLSWPKDPDHHHHQQQQLHEAQQHMAIGSPIHKSVTTGPKKWIFRDVKDRRKEVARAHNAQVHAAIQVAGLASAIAAIAAETAAKTIDEAGSKTAMAMASAASLVASQCVEVAEGLGADHEHVSAVVASAVRVKTTGDIMTLTAGAATSLRGAAVLKSRVLKDNGTHHRSSVIPYDKVSSSHSEEGGSSSKDSSEAGSFSQEFLSRGTDLLKRSLRTGDVQCRSVSVYLNKDNQVILKLQSKGALKTNKKCIVVDLFTEIPAWPGRSLLENGEQRRYFGLKTNTDKLEEFECKNSHEHRLWTEGISHLLSCRRRQ